MLLLNYLIEWSVDQYELLFKIIIKINLIYNIFIFIEYISNIYNIKNKERYKINLFYLIISKLCLYKNGILKITFTIKIYIFKNNISYLKYNIIYIINYVFNLNYYLKIYF